MTSGAGVVCSGMHDKFQEMKDEVAAARSSVAYWTRHPKGGRWALHDLHVAEARLATAQKALADFLAVSAKQADEMRGEQRW